MIFRTLQTLLIFAIILSSREVFSMELKQEQFANFLKDHGVAMIDFFAPWCGPCRAMGPIVEEISKEMGEKVGIAKVDIDNASELAERFGVRAVPTFVFFKNGKPVETISGARTKAELLKKINDLL